MLKILWSWLLLVVLSSLVLLYQPSLASSHIDFVYEGSRYSVQSWAIFFIIILLLVIILSLANMVFYWRRRILIRKCKKYIRIISSVNNSLSLIKSNSETKLIIKEIKFLPISDKFKTILQKGLFYEYNPKKSIFLLYWHGSYKEALTLILESKVSSIVVMNLCCHLFLHAKVNQDLRHDFLRVWHRNSKKMFDCFPNTAKKVQKKLWPYYNLENLKLSWLDIPKKTRQELMLDYVKVLSNYNSWSDISSLINKIPLDNKDLLVWYCKYMPRDCLDIIQLQKTLKYIDKVNKQYVILALARAHAAQGSWQIVQTLIDKIDENLTYDLRLEINLKEGNLETIKSLLISDSNRNRFA